jgi:heavy metal translocating P-type ATPase
MEEKKYKVTGMFCAACAAHVEKAASATEGVRKAEVSLLTNSLEVTWAGKPNDVALEKAIKKAGYGAAPSIEETAKSLRNERKRNLRKSRIKLEIAAVLLVVLMYFSMGMMWAWPMVAPMWIDVALELGLATLIIGLYFPYFIHGTKQLFTLHPTMETLISLGSAVSYGYGVYSFALMVKAFYEGDEATAEALMNNVYFEAAAMILVLVSLGKYFEALAKSKTTSSLENLLSLTPETALLLNEGEEQEIPAEALEEGDLCLVKNGTRVPADGVITEGNGSLDEAALTGEAVPVYKKVGDKVIGSSLLREGAFEMKVTAVGEERTLKKIIHLVEEAANSKAHLASLADRISAFFVPVVIAISLATFLAWYFTQSDVSLAINMGISVLVVSCPCALGLATPVALMVGTGRGAEHGILIKDASSFESLSSVKILAFDKTGTLTTGHLQVRAVSLKDEEDKNALLSLESLSTHPLAEAMAIYLGMKGATKREVAAFVSLPGLGVEGEIRGTAYLVGNAALLKQENILIEETPELLALQNEGATVSYLAKEGHYEGYIALSDEPKEGAEEVLASLKKKGYELCLISGDNEKASSSLAKRLGIDEVYSSVKPDEKQKIIRQLKQKGSVAMIGDGINDAPSLEEANVGIALGSGEEIAIASAGLVLVKGSLLDLEDALALAKKTVANIKLNLFWAFFYNLIGIPLAAGALYYAWGWKLTPMIASAMMALSSVSVVLNALRLKIVKLPSSTYKR